nr:hypothetical protein GCM10020093_034920 [Planobispora longispora]
MHQRPGQDLVLEPRLRVGQQHQADAGGMQGQPPADAVEHVDGVPGRQPLDEQRVRAVPHGEQDVLMGRLVEVLHVRQRHLAQPVSARSERGQLPQPQSDHVPAVGVALQRAQLQQAPGQPQSRARRGAAGPAELGQGHGAAGGGEGGEQGEGPVDHGLALCRPAAPGAREVPEAFVTRAVCLTTRPEKDDRSRRPGIQVRERTVGGDAPADTLGRAGRDIVNACHSMEFRLVPPVRPS